MYLISWLSPTHVNKLLAGTGLCQVCILLCLSCLQDTVGTQILATRLKNKGLSWDLAKIVKDTLYLWAPWSLPRHLSRWLPLTNTWQSHDQLHLVKEGSHGGPSWSCTPCWTGVRCSRSDEKTWFQTSVSLCRMRTHWQSPPLHLQWNLDVVLAGSPAFTSESSELHSLCSSSFISFHFFEHHSFLAILLPLCFQFVNLEDSSPDSS